MRLLIVIWISVQCTFKLLGQSYFNEVYIDTSYYLMVATNVEDVEDGYIFPSPYRSNEDASLRGFNIISIASNGEFVSKTEVLEPGNGIIYANYAESFTEVDGGYVQCTRYNDTAVVVKVDFSFQLQWMTKVPDIEGFERCVELSNGQLLCISNSTDPDPAILHLYWLDQNGNIVYEKLISPFASSDFYLTSRVIELTNGDLLLSGLYLYNSDAQQWMIRLNSNGDEIWKKFWDYEYRDGFLWPIVISDNEAIAAFGHVDTVYNPNSADHSWYDSRIGTMRVDLDTGDTSDVILYTNVLSIPFITDFERTASGGFAILGFYQNVETFLPYSSFIMNLDPDRNLNWFKEYNHLPIEESDQQWSQAYDIDLTPDSGFVVAGTWVDPSIDNRQAPWLFKIDGCGDLQWNNCSLTEIAETPDRTAKIFAYPNPADDIIKITCNIQNPGILWYDLNGKQCAPQLLSKQQGEWVFSTKELTQGVYAVLCLSANGMSETIRVIIR
jgi:hypothetical protein